MVATDCAIVCCESNKTLLQRAKEGAIEGGYVQWIKYDAGEWVRGTCLPYRELRGKAIQNRVGRLGHVHVL